jgi:hypothetical protein
VTVPFAQHTGDPQGVTDAMDLEQSTLLEIECIADQRGRHVTHADRVRVSHALNTRRDVGRGAESERSLRHTRARLSHDGLSGLNSDTHAQPTAVLRLDALVEFAEALKNAKTCPDGTRGVVLCDERPSEVRKETVTQVLRNLTANALDGRRTNFLVETDNLPELLRVECRRKRSRTHEIAKHHREDPTLVHGSR